MTIFPLAVVVAAITSAVLLVTLWSLGELTPRALFLLFAWFLLAGYCQFLAASSGVTLIGLLAQTALALYLIVRWRLSA